MARTLFWGLFATCSGTAGTREHCAASRLLAQNLAEHPTYDAAFKCDRTVVKKLSKGRRGAKRKAQTRPDGTASKKRCPGVQAGHLPNKGDVLECSMVEKSKEGGIEWVRAQVLSHQMLSVSKKPAIARSPVRAANRAACNQRLRSGHCVESDAKMKMPWGKFGSDRSFIFAGGLLQRRPQDADRASDGGRGVVEGEVQAQ